MEDRWIIDWPVSERFPHYTRANAGEVMSDPVSPLSWTLGWENAMVLGLRDGWIRGGTHELSDFDADHPETFAIFGGYFYINLASCRMLGVRNPAVTVEQIDMAFFGEHPDVPPYVEQPGDQNPSLVEKIEAHSAWVMSATEWPQLLEDRAWAQSLRDSRGDLRVYSDAELVKRARSLKEPLHHLFEHHPLSGASSAIAPAILGAVGEAIGDPTIPMKLLAGVGDIDSAEPSYAMWAMSREIRASKPLTAAFDAGFDSSAAGGVLERLAADGSDDARELLADWDDFIAKYGSRGPNEWDMVADCWETKPTLALAALDRVRFQADDESPHLRHAVVAAQRETVTEEVRTKVADDAELSALLEGALVAGNMMAYRERTKTNIMKVVHEARMAFRELGRRAAEAGHLESPRHIFMLLERELEDFLADPRSFTATLSQRSAEYDELFELEPPFIIKDGNVPKLNEWPRRDAKAAAAAVPGDQIVGVAGSPGTVRGTARVVLDPSDPFAFEPGDILVAPYTDPSWTPLFLTAGGVVVDVGGQVSHAIIVSRELGLPRVASATDATIRIPNGATVGVDGNNGTVTVVETT